MDELVKIVSQKTGLPEDQAKAAALAVIDFLKQKLPAPIGSQIDGVLGGSGAGDIAKNIGGLFG
jgi:hypothetical protein